MEQKPSSGDIENTKKHASTRGWQVSVYVSGYVIYKSIYFITIFCLYYRRHHHHQQQHEHHMNKSSFNCLIDIYITLTTCMFIHMSVCDKDEE